MLKQKLFTLAMLFSFMGSALLVTAPAYAQGTNTNNNSNFFSGLIHFIAQKFGLDQNQVKAAVTQYHTEKKANALQNFQKTEKARLDKLVSSGKITPAQETAVIGELAALRSKYSLNGNLTPRERRENLQSFQNDLKAWAQNQNINLQYIEPGYGMGRGMHKGFGRWNKITPTPTP
ncbi:MAG: hypothetical protein ACM3IJ_01235 [Candidatus Levyibacteriota bacterium]